MTTANANELLSLIYHYYPQKCSFSSHEYQASDEYSRYLSVINDDAKRTQINKRLFPSIVEYADGYAVMLREHSDNSNYPSIQYTILLHKNQPILDDDVDLLLALGGRRLDLEFYFSLLENYCYYYIIETVGREDIWSWKFSVLTDEQLPQQEKELVNMLCSKMSSFGFKLLNRKLAHKVVPEVETDLIPIGSVTVFNCLFTDMDTQYF